MLDSLTYLWAKVAKKSRLAAAKGSTVHPSSKLESGTSFYQSTMGKHSFVGHDSDVVCAEIGSFTSIANGVVIGGGRHPMEWVGMSPVFYEGRDSVKAKFSQYKREPNRRVTIGHDVWIGHSAIVLPGVQVSDGAVVGAGAIVTKDVPAYAIVAGNPARIVRYRFDEATIARLLAIRWWDLEEDALRRLAVDIKDVAKFLEKAESESGAKR